MAAFKIEGTLVYLEYPEPKGLNSGLWRRPHMEPNLNLGLQASIQGSRLQSKPPGLNLSLQGSIQASRPQSKAPGLNLSLQASI